MASDHGLYVETQIEAEIERVWAHTQDPLLHQRWDLRFSRIAYLPRASADHPQHFLYETQIGFGLKVAGRGESIGTRESSTGERTSALKFWSDDWKALIRTGSGYWKYIPNPCGTQFLTWYDYQTRFGFVGRMIDSLLFRRMMGWATAWSFDRLRLWLDCDVTPEASLRSAQIHAVARITLAFVWLWHGLVPKILFLHRDEIAMLSAGGVGVRWVPVVGAIEMAMGVFVLLSWHRRSVFLLNAALMLVALAGVLVKTPEYLISAFNPVTLNLSVIALSLTGWIAATDTPFATRCLRKPKKEGP